MTYQLASAKVWDGSAWVPSVGLPAWPVTVQNTDAAGVNVTADAAVNTKGAWTEVIPSTAAAGDFLTINVRNFTVNAATEGLIDIGVGAAGSETVVVPNVPGGQIGLQAGHRTDFVFPVSVPAGSRVAVRLQSVVASRVASVDIGIALTGLGAPSTLDAIGADTAASRGTNLPTADTYVELTASTSQAYRAIVMAPIGATATAPLHLSVFTLAKGPSGSETELGKCTVRHVIQEICTYTSSQFPFIYYGKVPAGTRLAVKDSIGSVARDVILYGVPA